MESILNWVKFKAQTQLNKKCSSVKHSKIKGIPKLDDANDAGKSMTDKPLSQLYQQISKIMVCSLGRVGGWEIWTKNLYFVLG